METLQKQLGDVQREGERLFPRGPKANVCDFLFVLAEPGRWRGRELSGGETAAANCLNRGICALGTARGAGAALCFLQAKDPVFSL